MCGRVVLTEQGPTGLFHTRGDGAINDLVTNLNVYAAEDTGVHGNVEADLAALQPTEQ